MPPVTPAKPPPQSPLSPGLPRPVLALGWVSLAQDFASEMVTPLIPLLVLGPLGGSASVVGLIEGLAEGASQALKPWAGTWSDRLGRHRSLTVAGYALSNLARPLIGLASLWGTVLLLRVIDRLGKGLRTAPRDALLAHSAPAAMRGAAFGFHRSMDHLGAALGPLAAIGLLAVGASLPAVILASALPGALTILLVWRAPLPTLAPTPTPALGRPALDARGRRLVVAATLLAFANLPEAFMVVWAHQAGWNTIEIAGLWVTAHLLKTLAAYPAGVIADWTSRERVVLVGWCARVLVLACGTQVDAVADPSALLAVFLAYAVALALSEGAERALIAHAAPVGRRGAAFGWYAALPGLAAVPGAVIVGAIWDSAGAPTAFAVSALLGACAAAALATLPIAEPVPRPGA